MHPIPLLISELSPAKLALFPPSISIFVQTSCPRLSIDWGTAFGRPVLTTYEASVAVGRIQAGWEGEAGGGDLEGDYPQDFWAVSSLPLSLSSLDGRGLTCTAGRLAGTVDAPARDGQAEEDRGRGGSGQEGGAGVRRWMSSEAQEGRPKGRLEQHASTRRASGLLYRYPGTACSKSLQRAGSDASKDRATSRYALSSARDAFKPEPIPILRPPTVIAASHMPS